MPPSLLSATIGTTRLDICVADITTLAVDAIVNAANTTLLGGAVSTGPFIAPPGRNCSRNAGRSAAARPDPPRLPAAIG